MKRRKFIKDSSILAGGICTGTLGLLPGCLPFTYAEYTIDNNKVVINKKQFQEQTYVIIKLDNLKKPVFVGELENGDYAALLMECTHKGCTVRPAGNILACPCHGSEYNRKGEVIESPAERNLMSFKVTHDENNIYIF